MRLLKVLFIVLILVSLVTLGEVIYCMAVRTAYPFELTKMEGVIVDHARRIAADKPVFAPPSAEFVPLLYFPLSYYPAAWMIRAGLDGFLASRLVSIASVILVALVGMWLVTRATRHRGLALMVPVLLAATYFDTRCFYDQARSDSLMSLFYLLAVAALTVTHTVAVVPLFVTFALLAFLTKQSAAVLLLALIGGVFFVRRAAAVISIAVLVPVAVALVYWINGLTDGWLYTYCFHAPAFHGLGNRTLVDAMATDFLGAFIIATAAALLGAVFVTFSPWGWRTPGWDTYKTSWRVLLIGTLAAGCFALVSIWQQEAVKNVYVVYAVMTAVLIPAAVGRAVEWLRTTPHEPAAWPAALMILILLVARGVRDPEPYLPTKEHAAVWQEMRQTLLSYGPPGRLWATIHGAAFGAGPTDPTRPHLGALYDYVGGYFGDMTGHEVPKDLEQRIRERYFKAILVADWDYRAKKLIGDHYQIDDSAPTFRLPAFYGVPPGQESIWIPRSDGPVDSAP